MCISATVRGLSLWREWLERGSGERQTVSKGEVEVIKVVEGRGRGLKKGVVSPCVQAGAAHWKGRRRGRKRKAGLVTMATLHYSRDGGSRSTAVLAFRLNSGRVMEGGSVLYVPTACQRRQKRRSLCYLADCDLLSVVLTKNNKITSLPHSSSQGKNQSTPCFTMKRLWWQMHVFPLCQSVTHHGLMWQSKSMSVTLIRNVFSKKERKKKKKEKKVCCAFCSQHCPSQPFHARGRFELDAGCMRRRRRRKEWG